MSAFKLGTLKEKLWAIVATSFVATLLAVSADLTAVEVAPAELSAPLLVVPRTETVAFILTASGTTVAVPVALTVM